MLSTLKALADPTRLRLLGLLARGEFSVTELTALLGMGQSRVSRHLKILVEAGMLEVSRQGTWNYYRLAARSGFFAEIWPAVSRRLESRPEHRRDLVALAAFLEERRSRSREFFDRHARQWDDLAARLLPLPDYREELLGLVPECGLAVEVGVGTGALLAALPRRARRVVGVDHAPAMLEQARERADREGAAGVELRLGDMNRLPVESGEASAVVLDMVLHHAAHPGGVLAEAARALAPGGVLVVADLRRHDREWVRERVADRWLGFERGELEGWLAAAGLAPERFEELPGKEGEWTIFLLRAVKPGAGPMETTEAKETNG